jgi:two-component system cell cycle response regulator
LVVDDIEANVKLLEAKLSSEYFDVLTAYSGLTALEIAETEIPPTACGASRPAPTIS